MAKVSIIIPTFNSEMYIRETIESAIFQTLEDIEIIIADCVSKDRTLDIIDEYAKKDERIKILHRPMEFVGLSRNAALDVATGEYVMFLDSDDLLEPTACEEAYNQIKKNNDDVVLFDRCSYNNDTQEKKFNNSKLKFLDPSFKTGESFHFWDIKNRFINGAEAWYKIYKKSFLDENNIRFESEKFCEDVPFFFKVIACAKTFSILDKFLYVYRLVNTSATTTSALKFWRDSFTTRMKAYDAIIKSEHSKELIVCFLIYCINALIYWYNRWGKIKDFPKKEYYNEMHKFFKMLKENHPQEIENVKEFIDYKTFCHYEKEDWDLHCLLKILKEIFSVNNEKNHKVIKICGIKIKIKNDKQKKLYKKITQNYLKLIPKIKQKVTNGEKIRVAFYVNDTRWKCQNIFDLMLKSKYYEPFILVGRHSIGPLLFEYQTEAEMDEIINFYKEHNMPVFKTYDYQNKKHILLEKFEPDIIFYSRPFGIASEHNIDVTSKFALSCYVPYYISNSPNWLEAGSDFHNNLWKYYVINNDLSKEYKDYMQNGGGSVTTVGYPFLENYIGYDAEKAKKDYTIYAPHCSVGKHLLNYATFDWNGKYILEFAKAHPEINWVFKPHPILKGKLVDANIMTQEEVDNYWAEWAKIGIVYEGPDYLDLFKKSKALITDCGSFLAEYMPTKNPVILLRSKRATAYNFLAKKVTKYYYSVWNIEQLEEQLNRVILQNRDPWKERRLAMLESLHLVTNASQNIIDNLNKEFGIEVNK